MEEPAMAEFLYLYRGSERVTAGMSPQQMQDYLQRFAGWRLLFKRTLKKYVSPFVKSTAGVSGT
jgi:hypothetical protein